MKKRAKIFLGFSVGLVFICSISCDEKPKENKNTEKSGGKKYLTSPLIEDLFTADPSAHVFENKIYIYPSHDIDAEIPENDNGDHFAMKDYHVYSMDSIGGKVTDHGMVLDVSDVPWAKRQMWAPDAAYKDGTYFLYFPAKDANDIFRIGVATSDTPYGPFKPQKEPILGSFSIDPAVFTDTDGSTYMYFGGIWGGQLQRWTNGIYDSEGSMTDLEVDSLPALSCKVAKLSSNMLKFDEPVRDVIILDSLGQELRTGDYDRRFFEGSWMHKYHGKYYFSYSTGDTHYLAYAIGESPLGPLTYAGHFMTPVQGWTTHHSIIESNGKWYLFYHDTELSGKTWLRNIKVTELEHLPDGTLKMIYP
ncbi:alpha-N-arabinofuranosidase [Neptunitalea chrysea]|uniref:Alpha-N-arabinofuranosidase n=1 Tax=Neptunitalea chrysea TaxID=1647581 RepID=A0A9W6B6Z3_9FLAO|nr:glycoside hydrolase family 43 protein [Neptunitalea chrysea]GLB51868.1 alpha-N-arabinofuranosidase [Neptunitalea chrysea]